MALLTLGSMVTDARGSVGGTVYSRNKGGAYARGRVVPINRATPKQTVVRNNFAANSKLWSGTLTATQRAAWTAFAAANPSVNVLGASIILSGIAMMMSLNQVLAQIGATLIDTPPANLNVPALATVTGATATAATPLIELNTASQSVVSGAKYYIFATAPLAAGKTPTSSAYRFMGAYAASSAATVVAFTTAYSAAFGAWTAGASIGVLAATVNTASGAVTPGLTFNIVSS
jgi:hypothetical protein